MMIPDADVFLYYVDHLGTDEAITQNEDGTYSIFLDPQLSPETRKKKYEHALEHIRKMDFERQNVQAIESRAHHVRAVPEIKESSSVVKIAQTRKYRRKNTAKKWSEVNERVEFIKRHDPGYFFRQGEYNKLYGGL